MAINAGSYQYRGVPLNATGPTSISTGPPNLMAWDGAVYESYSSSSGTATSSGLFHDNSSAWNSQSNHKLQTGFGLPTQIASETSDQVSWRKHEWGLFSDGTSQGTSSWGRRELGLA